ncbi:PH domain-containing protein [Bacteroides sp.]|uniref:PH domain-containing protein n=1 Tax=Bacteroides sp. TaxID=29523 RepID=UPI002633AD65|nr:PH domain-containing protein [Bacteroides sp.]MDD3039291.1 PH domain-containing protein [Bacteroides sp.]
MSYINNNLQVGETVEYCANIHWFIFAKPAILLLLGYLFYSTQTDITHYAGLFMLVLGGFHLIKSILLKIGTEYIVTNKRVILKSGILSRDALELMLNKCEGMRINQSVMGRIFGFGSILVTTGGVTNTFRFVANPMKFRNEINRQIQ